MNKKFFAGFMGLVLAFSMFQFAGAGLNDNYRAIMARKKAFSDAGPRIADPVYIGPAITPQPTPSAIPTPIGEGFGGLTCSLLRPVSASASSEAGPTMTAAHAIDQNPNTMWNSGGYATQANPKWIQLDLGLHYDVQAVRLLVAQLPDATYVPKPNAPFHVILTGATSPVATATTLHKDLINGTWEQVTFASVATHAQYMRIQTPSSPSWVAWYEIEVCGTPSMSEDIESGPAVTLCPREHVSVEQTTMMVGQTTTVSAPYNWRGGSFHSTNANVISVVGNVLTARGVGTAQVYGLDFLVGTNWPCTADAVTITVMASPTPTPTPTPTVPAFIGGYRIISNCATRTASISATSPVPAEIRFDDLRLEKTPADPGTYTGPRSVSLSLQSDGSYRGSITVNTHDFPAGTAVIFRLYSPAGNLVYPGYGAVSHDYDAQCN
ncbi:MAG: discoidin domain-containing protein [Candidatus Doudnabacteria bacterium]|nr:discoidin domain-containing protein [Candidatus Doudnabacteria bacterium]